MSRSMPRLLTSLCLILVVAIWGRAALAQDSQIADGVTIYLGIVPAAVVRAHPAQHPESSMHRSEMTPDQYHVMVALFDAKTGQRITDAPVTAKVGRQTGGGQVGKKLEPMNIADSITYGNYFPMPGAGPYMITVHIYRPGTSHTIEAQFIHKHS